MEKKLISLLIVLVMCLTLTAPTVLAAGGPSGGPSSSPITEDELEALIEDAGDDTGALINAYKRAGNAYKGGSVTTEDGESLPADYDKAAEYFVMAGELGDGFAFFDAGELYEQGKIGDEPDFSTAWDLYVEAAGTTSPNCKGVRNIGQWYEEGNDYVDQNYRKAAAFYNWAILLDDASSCYYLGNLYLQGYLSADGEPNYEQAAHFFQMAADKNNDGATGVAKAIYELGVLTENGDGVEADAEAALALYQRAVDAGEEKLGDLYDEAADALDRLSNELG